MTEDLAQLTARNQAFIDENRKELTRKLARELGQPEDTPLHVLNDLRADERRKQLARELGQPEETPLWKLNDLD